MGSTLNTATKPKGTHGNHGSHLTISSYDSPKVKAQETLEDLIVKVTVFIDLERANARIKCVTTIAFPHAVDEGNVQGKRRTRIKQGP